LSRTETSDDGPRLREVLLSPRGRLPRLDMLFAIFCAAIILGLVGLIWMTFALALVPPSPGLPVSPNLPVSLWIAAPALALALAGLWVLVCLLAKRCHDRDRSAWFLLILLVPGVQVWPLIELVFFRGSRDLNHYGPMPNGMYRQWLAANADM
jgi:uncharacterized membrane protein YhaH (DUF805 family)